MTRTASRPRSVVVDPTPNPPPRPPGPPSLAGLSVAGITRRRVGWAVGTIVAAWFIVSFGGQVSAGSAATERADAMQAENARLEVEVAALERELAFVQEPVFIDQQARAYGLGQSDEHRFALSPDAPPLDESAPGSASRRLGARAVTRSPLESWMTILFGPGD